MPAAVRGLQCLVPSTWPPLVVRHISEYADVKTRACSMLRLSLHGVLHDAYCLYEGPDKLVVMTAAGIVLQVRSSDCGVLSWPVDADTNPYMIKCITPDWLQTILEPRSVTSYDILPSSEPNKLSKTLHRRLRCYRDGESARHPCFPPFFVYVKLFTSSFVLRGVVHDAPSYMREAAVLSTLLPLCHPLPCPTTYYYVAHEETGSSCSVVEDVTSKLVGTANVVVNEALAKRIMLPLALLHGRFMAPHVIASDEPTMSSALPRWEQDLRSALIHPMIFFSDWQRHLDSTLSTAAEDEAAKAAAESGGSKKAAIARLPASLEAAKFGPFFAEEALRQVYDCALPSVVIDAGSAYKPDELSLLSSSSPPLSPEGAKPADAASPSMLTTSALSYPHETQTASQLNDRSSAVPTWCTTKQSSLTLIHGSLDSLSHVLTFRDPRQEVPSCLLVDWKNSGIGPLEVDLLDVFLTFLTTAEQKSKETIMRLLDEYCECLRVFCGVERQASALLKSCRDVARLRCYSRTRSEGFAWGATKKRMLIDFANVLSSMVS